METIANAVSRAPWNKGKIVGRNALFKLKDIYYRAHLDRSARYAAA